MTTTARLDAIEAQLGTITPGPWEARDWTTVDIDGAPVHCEVRIWSGNAFVAGVLEGQDPDAVFIAAAPDTIRELLTLARKQAAALERVVVLADVIAEGASHSLLNKVIARSIRAALGDGDE